MWDLSTATGITSSLSYNPCLTKLCSKSTKPQKEKQEDLDSFTGILYYSIIKVKFTKS